MSTKPPTQLARGVKMAKGELTAEQRDHLEQHVAGIGHNQGPALLEHTEEIIEPARHHRLKAELTGIHRRRLFNRLQGLWIRSSSNRSFWPAPSG